MLRAILPLIALVLVLPVVLRLARSLWLKLDHEALGARQDDGVAARVDRRIPVSLVTCAAVLTLQHYYGSAGHFTYVLAPRLKEFLASIGAEAWFASYGDLVSYVWWGSCQIAGFVIVPVVVWRIFFPAERMRDMGLYTRDFVKHLWIYGACLGIVLVVIVALIPVPDIFAPFPFYRTAQRSWFDFVAWEAIYIVQFLALEFFFRGFLLHALKRTLGAAAVFVAVVPYCMIHFGKSYPEAQAAIVAGVVLGFLALKTRSIYAGFIVHSTVGLSADLIGLWLHQTLPTAWWPN